MNAVEESEMYKAFKGEKDCEHQLLTDHLNFEWNILYDSAIRIQTDRCKLVRGAQR